MRIIIFLLLLCSCGTSKFQKLELQPGPKLVMEMEGMLSLSKAHAVEENDTFKVVIEDYKKRTLLVLDFENRVVIQKIPVSFFAEQYIYGFYYKNRDSIFLLFNAAKNLFYKHDSTLLMINDQGEIKRSYSLRGIPVFQESIEFPKKDSMCVIQALYGTLEYAKGKLFLPLSRYKWESGDSLFENPRMPIAAHVDISEDTTKNYRVYFPVPQATTGTHYMPRGAVQPRITANSRGLPIVSLGHCPQVFVYDYEKDQIDTFTISSVLFGGKVPMNLYEGRDNPPQTDFFSCEFLQLYYNPYGKYYVRFFRLPQTPEANQAKLEPRYIALFFDDRGKVFAEGIIPEGFTTFYVFFDKAGIWLWNRQESKAKQQIIVQRFQPRFKACSPAGYIESIRREPGLNLSVDEALLPGEE